MSGEELLTVVRQSHDSTFSSCHQECLYYLDISNNQVTREQQTVLRHLLSQRVKCLKLDIVDNPLADFVAQM